MNDGIKIIIAMVIGIMFLASLLGMGIHSKNRGKQLLLKEVGIEATYWEAAGMSKDFIEGRLVERELHSN
jgi:hypothetical protein